MGLNIIWVKRSLFSFSLLLLCDAMCLPCRCCSQTDQKTTNSRRWRSVSLRDSSGRHLWHRRQLGSELLFLRCCHVSFLLRTKRSNCACSSDWESMFNFWLRHENSLLFAIDLSRLLLASSPQNSTFSYSSAHTSRSNETLRTATGTSQDDVFVSQSMGSHVTTNTNRLSLYYLPQIVHAFPKEPAEYQERLAMAMKDAKEQHAIDFFR